MGLSANDEFLDAIAQQAQVAYAAGQLRMYQDMLQDVLTPAGAEEDGGPTPHTQHKLAYYSQQVERWQEYLKRLIGIVQAR